MNYYEDDPLKMIVAHGNYWVVNWEIVQHFGRFDDAIILAYLCSQQKYHSVYNYDYLEKHEGMFYCTAQTMREQTTIEPRRQRDAINNLIDMGLIEMKYKGIPKKRHFKVNMEGMLDFFIQSKDED